MNPSTRQTHAVTRTILRIPSTRSSESYNGNNNVVFALSALTSKSRAPATGRGRGVLLRLACSRLLLSLTTPHDLTHPSHLV